MPTRVRLLTLFLSLLLSTTGKGANLDGSSAAVGNAEAARLYSEANDYVNNLSEGQYSYAYLQFYWKRAQSNVDRVRRVYPESPTAQAMGKGMLKLGTYDLDYFRNRVLYNVELKQLGSFDDVNCAIFLYGIDPARSDAKRDEALANIIEVLARRQRWGEALRFPVLSAHRPILLRSLFRIAAFYGNDDLAKKLTATTSPADQEVAGFDPIQAEAIALQGRPRAELYNFVDSHPQPGVRSSALQGAIEREILIRRMERLHLSFKEAIQTVHLVIQNVSRRDKISSVTQRIFAGNLDAAAPILSVYYAAEGTAPNSNAPIEAHLAYLQYLADTNRMDLVSTYVHDNNLSGSAKRLSSLKVIELYAEAGQKSECAKARKAFAQMGTPDADDAALAEFRGRMDSSEDPLVVRQKTFAELPIADPCIMATAIMEWSLTPNRSQRGATPWDSVITRFAGGFENLPLPKSTVVGDAASTLKPY